MKENTYPYFLGQFLKIADEIQLFYYKQTGILKQKRHTQFIGGYTYQQLQYSFQIEQIIKYVDDHMGMYLKYAHSYPDTVYNEEDILAGELVDTYEYLKEKLLSEPGNKKFSDWEKTQLFLGYVAAIQTPDGKLHLADVIK